MEQIAINILPKGAKPVCHSSQFDEGRQIRFNLFNDTTPYTLSGTETISVLVRKPDGTEVIDSVTNTSNSYVVWDVSTDACELSGVCECELSIVENGIVLGSKNFTMKVEEDAYNGKTIEVRTASGRIATFNTNMVEAFKSLITDINPVQDLHGYSKPWSGGGGKNKLPNTYTTQTINGVTFTVNNDGSVKVNGTASNTALFTLAILGDILTNGQSYYINGNASDNKAFLQLQTSQYGGVANIGNDYNLVYSTSGEAQILVIRVNSGQTANNITIKPMIRLPNASADFEPYSNICPISGFSALNVTRTGKNLLDKSLLIDQVGWNIFTLQLAPNTTYTMSSNLPNSATSELPCYVFPSSGNPSSSNLVYSGHSVTLTTLSDGLVKIQQRRVSGTDSFQNYNWQIENGNQSSEYHAYNGQTATVNFGQTVYGGVADVTNGKLKITHGIVDLGTLDWSAAGNMWYASLSGVKPIFDTTVPNAICTQYKAVSWVSGTSGTDEGVFCFLPAYNQLRVRDTSYSSASDFKTAMSGVMLCYELATPTEITTTPENLTAIVGVNNVCSDTGDTTVEFYIEV